MADSWEPQTPPRLAGYESWLCQMPCIGNTGDVFVSIPLPGQTDLDGESHTCWLIAIGDVSGRGEPASRLKALLESEITRLAGTMTDPGSILAALNANLLKLAEECHFATLVVTLINSDRHELTIANAGHVPPFLRRLDRRIESLAEEVSWFPLWIDPSQTYENGIVPIGLGEVVTFQSGGVTGIVNDEWNLDDDLLRQAIAQAPHGAASVGQSILEAISRFRGSRAQVDDITLLCLGRVVPTEQTIGKVSR